MDALTPATFCSELIGALEASEGRRRRRKRNTTPDAIGLAMKRDLLEQAVADAPATEEFEEWLFQRVLDAGDGSGGLRAVAVSILEEWRFALQVEEFRGWLAAGAPSDDARRLEVQT
ncbi:MAG TPA: hypothetical protein VFU06_09305 [Longimicrobiales bacterium]|nr:hypothetical protein [Longimicrobiales bacterium]